MIGRKLAPVVLAVAGIFMSAPASAAPAASLVLLGTFKKPVYLTVAPGYPDLLFVVERAGRIQLLRDEVKLAQPFLDISDLVLGLPDGGAGPEQGLLSVAFPPDYAQTRRLYVAFTNKDGAVEINEFKRVIGNATRVDRSTRRILLVIPHSGAQNHNGGQLQFDQNGLLYISVGDGGALEPPGEPARNLNSLLGKVLRIDPLPTGSGPYGIPSNNPFVGKPGRNEIFAYGLRNPWRFSLDGSRIAVGDVGAGSREEVNFLPLADARGANFGWPQYEGDVVFDNSRPGPDPATFPLFTYSHNAGRCAIIGGYVVRNTNLPALDGRYLYGDTCTGEVRSFIPHIADQDAVGDRSAGITLPRLTSFGLGFNGKIYAAQLTGQVWRFARP
jgi:glucose/arabinose dehydrogenase